MNKEERRVLEIASKRKKMVKCLIFKEKTNFKKLVTDSKPQPFSRDFFQFDEQFANIRVKETLSKANIFRPKFELEKSLLGTEKVNYFVVRGITPTLKIVGIL